MWQGEQYITFLLTNGDYAKVKVQIIQKRERDGPLKSLSHMDIQLKYMTNFAFWGGPL